MISEDNQKKSPSLKNRPSNHVVKSPLALFSQQLKLNYSAHGEFYASAKCSNHPSQPHAFQTDSQPSRSLWAVKHNSFKFDNLSPDF